jgi:large subunit ribosomal protein L5
MEIPSITKIVINIAHSNTSKEKIKLLESAYALELITGRKPVFVKARKSISTFNLREGIYTAVKVTLREDAMYLFLDNLIHTVLPRVRDFKGVSLNSFDTRGNYTLSVNNMFIFPELEYEFEKFSKPYGMDITIVTSANNSLETRLLLSAMQLPFIQK